jgi:hypothetical protein
MRVLGLTTGSFGILKFERSHQGLIVGRDGLLVLFQALDVASNGILGHFLCFGYIAPERDASRQRGNNHRESTFGLGAQNEIKMTSRFLH